MIDQTGKTVSHYRIIGQLGQGGMGVVYKAEDTKLKRAVALKFLPPELTREPEAKERFIHEAQAASTLDHPNICTVHEIGETDDGQMFIAMACYDGETLKKKIDRGPLKIDKAIDITVQVSQGLQKAHEHGIVHRDIKPANVLVTGDGVAKIVDFGLAKLAGQTKLTKAGSTLGTVAYMSPEQARGEEVDARTDIWSLGVMLYEMLTGQLPFKGQYENAVVYSIVNADPEPITGLRTGVPMDLERIVNKCLQKTPDERYQTAMDLAADLRHLQRTKPTAVQTTELAPLLQQRRKIWSLPRWLVVGSVLLIFFVAAILIVLSPWRAVQSNRKSIAVLPFKNMSDSKEDEYFSDGITEDIITQLSKISDLLVISRTSVMQYKGTGKRTTEIARELGVATVLEGSVRRSGDQVRIVAQLIDGATDKHIWADTYDKQMMQIFAIQSEVAQKIAAALKAKLSPEEQSQLASKADQTHNLQAYDYLLRGMQYLHRSYSKEDFQIGTEFCEKAVQEDTTFALAYARLGYSHCRMYWFHHDHTAARLTKAKEAIDKALLLQPSSSEAHAALGYYYYWGLLDYGHALEQLGIAQERDPNNSDVLYGIGAVKRRQGRFVDAVTNFKKALELDPRRAEVMYNLAETYNLTREYGEAERYLDVTISLQPDWADPYNMKAWVSIRATGSTTKARPLMATAMEKANKEQLLLTWVWLEVFDGNYQAALNHLGSGSSQVYANQFYYWPKVALYATIYGLMKRPSLAAAYYDSARVLLERNVKSDPEDSRYHSALGIAYAGLGRKKDAISEGKLAVQLLPVSKEAYRGTMRVADLAYIYAMVGEQEAAIKELEFLLSVPSEISPNLLRIDPKWAPLRQNPGFQKLLEGR